jgi:hypothetical protein
MGRFVEKYIVPVIVPFVILAIIILIFSGIGELFLSLFQPGDTPDRLDRPELWTGITILLGIIAVMAFLSSRPKGALGPLEKQVAIGSRPLWADELPPVNVTALRGTPGTVADIDAGYTLYAGSGAIGRVLGILPGGSDYGKRFSGFLHAEGVGHASNELWIPFEAVSAVYPETHSAFLAIKGDETESFGWTSPPETITRGAPRHQSAADKLK